MHIRQTEVAARVAVGEPSVVEAEQMQHRGVQIVQVDFVVDRKVTVVVGRVILEARLHAAAGQSNRVAMRVVVAAIVALRGGRAAEFAAPEHERIIQ